MKVISIERMERWKLAYPRVEANDNCKLRNSFMRIRLDVTVRKEFKDSSRDLYGEGLVDLAGLGTQMTFLLTQKTWLLKV